MAMQIVLIALALVSGASAQKFFGGASSIAAFANDIVAGYNKKYSARLPGYDSVGSGAGISGFISKTYRVGASDEPLNNLQNTQASNAWGGKYTIPFILSTYSIMTKKASGLKLTAGQVASIYKAGGISSWSQVKSGLSGAIVPVARSDSSGTTNVVSSWIKTGSVAWIEPANTAWSSSSYGSFFKSSVQFRQGTSGVGALLVSDSNSIGYIQTGSGLFRNLREVAVRNKALSYVTAANASPAQSIPSPLPASDGNWNGVSLINKSGKATYPIVSFAYAFVGKKAGKTARVFMEYTQSSSAQNLVNTRYEGSLFRLPAVITRKNLIAIRQIK